MILELKSRLQQCKIKSDKRFTIMNSQKRIKIQSFLSLPSLASLPSLPTNKKYLLKPLQLSEVIVVMVEQQLSVDKIKQLRSYLTKNRRKTVCLDQQQRLITSALQNLPDFAKKQWGQTQLLKYHLSRKRPNPKQELEFYQKKLSQIQIQFSNSLERYKNQLQEGKNSIEEIQTKVNSLYQTTIITKQHIKLTNQKIQKYTQHILNNIKREKNITKTIAIAKAWSKSNISKVLSKNLSQIDDIKINEFMKQMDDCSKAIKIQGENGQLQNSDKVLKVIEDRRNLVIQKVQKNMMMSIVNFIGLQKYEKVYQQYNDLLHGLAWCNEQKWKEYHQLQKQNLMTMIQQNIDHIYWNSLKKVSPLSNIELLSDQNFTQFLQYLVQSYNNYIVKWHKVTAYHVNKSTQHKDNFLKMFVDVADKIIKKIFHLIKYYQKFYSFSFEHKVKAIIQINKLVEFIEEWTGKKDISLYQVLKQKLRAQNENYRKEVNGFVKIAFVEQFSQQGIMYKMKRTYSQDQRDQSPFKQSSPTKSPKKQTKKEKSQNKFEQREKMKEIVKTKLFSQMVDPSSVTLSPKKRPKIQISLEQKSDNQQKNILTSAVQQLYKQQFDLNLSKLLIKYITQYCQRQQTLPFGHLQCILEHMDLLILLIFKVCVYEQTKTKLFEDFSQRAFRNLKQIQLSVQRNPNDESIVSSISRMRESFINRRNYLQLHGYLANEIDSKFDTIVVSGFVNINKLYAKPEENFQLLNNYHAKLSKLIEELLKISRWVLKHQSKFSNYEFLSKKVQQLPTVLIQLALAYFQQYNLNLYYKYIEKMQPIMKNLKWKIEKFNQEVTLQFREYKLNMLQIFRSSSLNMGLKDSQLHQQLTNKHLEIFYKALLYMYCKIDKINDNGRQVIRLDAIQIAKILKEVGYTPGSWATWFQKYIQTTMDRNVKNLLQKIQQMGIVYPLYCWKTTLLYILGSLSTKEKKQYLTHLYHIYLEQIKHLPQL